MQNGKDFNIYMNANNNTLVLIAGSKSCSYETSCEINETSIAGDGKAKTYITGRTEWSVECNYLVTTPAWAANYLLWPGNKVTISLCDAAKSINLKGEAICTKCKETFKKGSLVTGTFTFQGTGPLEKIT